MKIKSSLKADIQKGDTFASRASTGINKKKRNGNWAGKNRALRRLNRRDPRRKARQG